VDVARWPVREGLIEHIRRARTAAEDSYRHAALLFAIQTPNLRKGTPPPKLPDILQLIDLQE